MTFLPYLFKENVILFAYDAEVNVVESHINNQTDWHILWDSDPYLEVIDAFVVSWKHLNFYLFSLFQYDKPFSFQSWRRRYRENVSRRYRDFDCLVISKTEVVPTIDPGLYWLSYQNSINNKTLVWPTEKNKFTCSSQSYKSW